MAIHTEGALDSTKTRAFLGGFDDDVFFFLAVGVASSVLAVLFAASFAAVALSAVWCVNARQVLGYEQEAKPNLTRCSLWQCGQVSVCVIGMMSF
jgi:hypothetical protein